MNQSGEHLLVVEANPENFEQEGWDNWRLRVRMSDGQEVAAYVSEFNHRWHIGAIGQSGYHASEPAASVLDCVCRRGCLTNPSDAEWQERVEAIRLLQSAVELML